MTVRWFATAAWTQICTPKNTGGMFVLVSTFALVLSATAAMFSHHAATPTPPRDMADHVAAPYANGSLEPGVVQYLYALQPPSPPPTPPSVHASTHAPARPPTRALLAVSADAAERTCSVGARVCRCRCR